MRHILVIDDLPSKVKHLEQLKSETCKVIFVETFVNARRALLAMPDTFDSIYLDYDLDGRHNGVDLLDFLVYDKGLKKGCRIIPNSSSDTYNTLLKQKILDLGLSRRQSRKS